MSLKDTRITSIVDAITQIAKGNFKSRVKISTSLDEIDGIATGINMRSTLYFQRVVSYFHWFDMILYYLVLSWAML